MVIPTDLSDNTASRDDPRHAQSAPALHCLATGVVSVARDGSIRYRNAEACRWLTDAPLLHDACRDIRFLGPFDGWPVELQRVFESRQTIRLECVGDAPGGGGMVLLTLRCVALLTEDAQAVDGVVIFLEEGAIDEALAQRMEVSRRLASLGKLAARVAHELNNPLDGILRYINLAMRVADDTKTSKLQDYLAESRTGLMRMVQIIGDLLEFTRTSDDAFDQSDVNEVIEQAIKSHTGLAQRNGVVIASDFQRREMPTVRGSRLYQVCGNLIKNGIEAMPQGGRLTIATGLVDEVIIIQVADTGAGPPDPPEKVFEPFFTTKSPSKGTGIGLAICKDFIEDMKGDIDIARGEEGGAVFTIRLPLSSCTSAATTYSPRRLTS